MNYLNDITFKEMLKDEQRCKDYVEAMQWPHKVHCPARNCGSEYWETKRGLKICNHCHLQFTALSRTIFENSHVSLSKWLKVMWTLLDSKNASSSRSAFKDLGISSNKTILRVTNSIRSKMTFPQAGEHMEGKSIRTRFISSKSNSCYFNLSTTQ